VVNESGEEELPGEAEAIERAFGVVNRRRILAEYFDAAGFVDVEDAWQHVYRLLLWINPTIGLAHCYESDKCQPHKAWYSRSLAFHQWVSDRLAIDPLRLREEIDHLFRAALPALARVETEQRRTAASRHLEQYPPGSMPMPGDDPDLVDIIRDVLDVEQPIETDHARRLVERIYTHFARENKRKNLLGRGFEDTLSAIIARLPENNEWTVRTRVSMAEIPGFLPPSQQGKQPEVDLAMWEPQPNGRRILVSAKWSVRADRERQFDSDFEDYSRSSEGGVFDYVLVTNEFDAARLDAACTRVHGRDRLFSSVVHVQPAAVLVAYSDQLQGGSTTSRRKAGQLPVHVESGRLISLEQWLAQLLA
jgi:hypothetical protein